MSTITIDGVEHDVDSMSDEQKVLYNAIVFCDAKLNDLANETAALKTARQAYINDLGAKLSEDGS